MARTEVSNEEKNNEIHVCDVCYKRTSNPAFLEPPVNSAWDVGKIFEDGTVAYCSRKCYTKAEDEYDDAIRCRNY